MRDQAGGGVIAATISSKAAITRSRTIASDSPPGSVVASGSRAKAAASARSAANSSHERPS